MGRFTASVEAYSIQVRAVFSREDLGYVGHVRVLKMPDGDVVLDEQVSASGRMWPRAQLALDAAYARGQQFVRSALVQREWSSFGADSKDVPIEWFGGVGYSLTGWQFDRNGDVQLPPNAG